MEITINITIKGVKHEMTMTEVQKLAEELHHFLPKPQPSALVSIFDQKPPRIMPRWNGDQAGPAYCARGVEAILT